MKKIYLPLMAATLAGGLLASGSALAAGVVTAPAPAALSGVYVSIFGGYAFGTTVGASAVSGPPATVSMPLTGGYAIGGAMGMQFTPNISGDVELSYVSHGAGSTATVTPSGSSPLSAAESGSLSTTYLLGNVWYDIDTGSAFTPYVGVGLGIADIMPNLTLSSVGTVPFKTASLAFAGQLGAGVKFKVADGVALDLAYRLRGVLNGTLVSTTPGSNIKDVTYADQSVQLGLQFNF